jgi:hypothetical protein
VGTHRDECPQADLLATMEAFDKYNNLCDAIFQHHIEDSAMIFNTERDPVLITIRAKGGILLLVKVSEFGLVLMIICCMI